MIDAGPPMGHAGTVAMAAMGTGNLVAIDVESGVSTVLDPGKFGDVSISPDGAYVEYIGTDYLPKLADRSGHVTALGTMETSAIGAIWSPDGALTLEIINTTLVLPHIGGTTRVLPGYSAVFSADHKRIAYATGSSVPLEPCTVSIEAVDGTSVDSWPAGFETYTVDLTPDGSGVVTYERSIDGPTHLALYSTTSHARTELALADYYPVAFPGLSRFSPDGRHTLFVADGALKEVDLDTVAIRTIATLDNILVDAKGVTLQVGYLDATHVIYNRSLNESGSPDQLVYIASLNVADGQTDVELIKSTSQSHPCLVEAADLAHQRLGVVCGHTSLVDLAGKTLVKHDGVSVLGIAKDGQAMVAVEADGTISYVPITGDARVLGVAQNPQAQPGPPFFGPYASFAP